MADRGTARLMIPAPERPAAIAQRAAAPTYPGAPATMTNPPTPHLCAFPDRLGRTEDAKAASALVSFFESFGRERVPSDFAVNDHSDRMSLDVSFTVIKDW